MPRGLVVSKDPLIVLSSINHDAPLGVISMLPNLFRGKKSLHFLSPAWSLVGGFAELRKKISECRITFPEAQFVVLANEEIELAQLQMNGLLTILANPSVFIDEQIFKPKPDRLVKFDAVYNAVFKKFKNHDLCADVSSLMLIYYDNHVIEHDDEKYVDHIRRTLKHAIFQNEIQPSGYHYMSPIEISDALNQCHTGLCLSAAEGTMRVCVETLLCGIPVVSIAARGGRMRYLNELNSRIVPADAASVAYAVQELKRLNINADLIRNDILSVLRFERRNFLNSANIFIAAFLGTEKLISDFSIFKSSLNYLTALEWAKALS